MTLQVAILKQERKRYVLETCFPYYEVDYHYKIQFHGAYRLMSICKGFVRLKRTHYIWPPMRPVTLIMEFSTEEWHEHLRSGYARRYLKRP